MNHKTLTSDVDYLLTGIDSLPETKVLSNLVECAEKHRKFREGTPFPGKQKFSRTPYMIEPALELSPQSDTEEVVIMKCGQGGATAGATEPLILFKILEDPGPVLAVTVNDELAKTWKEERLDPMFEDSEAKKKFKSTVTKNTQHGGKGDTATKTTWPGGRLDIKTYGKISQVRQISYQVVILEEEEEAAEALKQRGAKQGSFRDVAFARTRAFRGRRKILRISTPLLKESSAIYQAFLDGDQNYYYVPCPHCGHLQRLVWTNLIYRTDDNKIVDPESVYYKCENKECNYKIKNEDKARMLTPVQLGGAARWIPHNKEKAKPKTKSYTFSALYVPPGMDTWADLAQAWVNAQGDPEKLQVFYNLTLGEPYEDYSDAPPTETLHMLQGHYKKGQLPHPKEGKVLYTMLGCDVQAGNKRGGEYLPGKEPRIEASLYGFGLNNRIWLLDHIIIKGETNDYRSGAFKKLREKIIKKDFIIPPQKIFLDSGYQTDEVKKFCNGSLNIFPIMGDSHIIEKNKLFRVVDLANYRSGNGEALKLYELKTGPIKRRIYNRFMLRQDPQTGEYPDGYMMFPIDVDHKFFEQLTAEKPIPFIRNGKKGYKWDAGGRSNEAFDCLIYAIMANEAFMHEVSLLAGETATNERKFWEWAVKKFGKAEKKIA